MIVAVLLLCGERVGVTSMLGWHTAGGASVVWVVAGRHAARTPAAPACSTLSSRPHSVWWPKESIRQETITAQQLLVAADSRHSDAPFVPQSSKAKTLGETFAPSALLLDAKKLTGKQDLTVKSEADVYEKDGKLCLVLHHIKWWRHGRQSGTNRWVPLLREGWYGIPFEVGGDSWQDLVCLGSNAPG